MKNLITILLLLTTTISISHAVSVPVSEAQRYIDAAPGGVPPLYTCADKPEEDCLEVSHVEDWSTVEIVEVEGKKKLQVNSAKATEKLNRESADKAKKEAKKAKKASLKEIDWSKITTVASLKKIVQDLVESQEE